MAPLRKAAGLLLFAVALVAETPPILSSMAPPAQSSVPPPELGPVEPLSGPFVVAIQAGHWKAAELPDELARLRTSAGARSHGVREVDVNLAVARALQSLIVSRGWRAILLPSTIPPGLRADAFVAIHADWGEQATNHGWKVSAPWRPSPASLSLAAALAASFSAQPGFDEDEAGVTVGMRGYYAFSYRRFVHAVSPFTPCTIVELGFLTNPQERELLEDRPRFWARILDRGIARFLSGFDRDRVADLRPMVLPRLQSGPAGAAVWAEPSAAGRAPWHLAAGVAVIPVDLRPGWFEVYLRDHRTTGWIEATELRPYS